CFPRCVRARRKSWRPIQRRPLQRSSCLRNIVAMGTRPQEFRRAMPPAPGDLFAPVAKKGWSTWSTGKKVFIVLLSIFGGLMVLTMIAGAYGYYWLVAAGDQVPAQIVVGERSAGFISVHADVEDAGVKKLVALLDRKMKEMRL